MQVNLAQTNFESQVLYYVYKIVGSTDSFEDYKVLDYFVEASPLTLPGDSTYMVTSYYYSNGVQSKNLGYNISTINSGEESS